MPSLKSFMAKKRPQEAKSPLGTFSMLPPEIRSRIWHYATCDSPLKFPQHGHAKSQAAKTWFRRIMLQPRTLEFPILQASRQIYLEAHFELLNQNHTCGYRVCSTEASYAYHGTFYRHPTKRSLVYTNHSRYKRITIDIEAPEGIPSTSDSASDLLCQYEGVQHLMTYLRGHHLREIAVNFINYEEYKWSRNESLQYLHRLNLNRSPGFSVNGVVEPLTLENAPGAFETVRPNFRRLRTVSFQA